MNKIILEILPTLEKIIKNFTKDKVLSDDIRQSVVLKMYDYKDTVLRIYKEGNLGGWIYVVAKTEYLIQTKNSVLDYKLDPIYEEYTEPLLMFMPHLNEIERKWIDIYLRCEGSYLEIERRTGITRQCAKKRINSIIEKCKHLKSTL